MKVRARVAYSAIFPDILTNLSKDPAPLVRGFVAGNRFTPDNTVGDLIFGPNTGVAMNALISHGCVAAQLDWRTPQDLMFDCSNSTLRNKGVIHIKGTMKEGMVFLDEVKDTRLKISGLDLRGWAGSSETGTAYKNGATEILNFAKFMVVTVLNFGIPQTTCGY